MATGTVALPFPIVAADVSPLIIPAEEKFEPAHVGCYGISPGQAALPISECRRGNGARGSPCEIRRRQWEALARGIISQGAAHDAWR